MKNSITGQLSLYVFDNGQRYTQLVERNECDCIVWVRLAGGERERDSHYTPTTTRHEIHVQKNLFKPKVLCYRSISPTIKEFGICENLN